MKKAILLLLVLAIALGIPSCSQTASGQVLQSDKPRDNSPVVSEADLLTVVYGNGSFAFDLYQELKKNAGNMFFSPFSISTALVMGYAGARTETEKQMANVLHFSLPQERLHPVFNKLSIELSHRGEGAKGKDEKGFRLNIVNAIWGQRDNKFLPIFLDVLAENYGTSLRILDFKREPEVSRLAINEWVSDQTGSRIKDLVQQGTIDDSTKIILTNAVYFNAAWEYYFDKNLTHDKQFHLLDGNDISVSMMRREASFGYTEGDGYQAVELPYSGLELSMVILLPDTGQFGVFESGMTLQEVNSAISNLKPTRIAISMPKFKFESAFMLKETLPAMGMSLAFDEILADFSGITGEKNLVIADVVHKTYVSVDEDGTEAAAASGVIYYAPSIPPEVVIDRPFIFVIRDIQTGTILFLGRVVNPTAE